jgi:hypothetical protein
LLLAFDLAFSSNPVVLLLLAVLQVGQTRTQLLDLALVLKNHGLVFGHFVDLRVLLDLHGTRPKAEAVDSVLHVGKSGAAKREKRR